MHVPDHMLADPVSITTGAVACAALAHAAYRSRDGLSRQTIALTAATSAAVFALQMVNYPVAAGTSGHLMGGVLAAALVGPWLGMISVTLVLLVQAVVFADGGLTALGTNTVLMAVVGTGAGWAVTRVVQHARGSRLGRPRRAALAAGVGALVSVPVSAVVFVALFAVGGAVSVPLGELSVAMLSVHAVVGIGEALITAAVVGVVLAVAPGVAHVDPRTADSAVGARPALAAVAGIAALSGAVLSSFAASAPDGLESTASRLGFLDGAGSHTFAGLPFADYGAASGTPVGVAGLLGVVAVGLVAAGLLTAVRGTGDRRPAAV